MNSVFKKYYLLTLFVFATLTSFTQVIERVHWTFSSEQNGREVKLVFIASIDDNWHLYDINLPDGGPISTSFHYKDTTLFDFVGEMKSNPKPHDFFDSNFQMNLKYFEKEVVFEQKIRLKSDDAILVDGYVEFMACNDETCLPPTEIDFSFQLKKTAPKVATETAQKVAVETVVASEPPAETIIVENIAGTPEIDTLNNEAGIEGDNIDFHEISQNNSLWLFFFFSFFFGLTAIVTPCVFPMIPMTISFFMHGGKTKAVGRMNAFVYGISIIAIYTIIGTVVSVIFGPGIANWLSTHWLPNLLFFLVFIIFAFSFFGMFEIVLPEKLVNKSDRQADKGGFVGSFFMALTLVLVSFSCTGPIVGLILVESAGGQVLKPVVGMLGFSLAFAFPFTLFALFPQWLTRLPKSGGWLNSVKVVLGFIELALGLKFLSVADQTYHWGILDREVYLALWIVIFSLLGFYLLGKIKFIHDSDVKHVGVPRLMLSVLTFAFVVYLVPGMFGAPLKAISGYMPPLSTHDFDIHKIVRDEIKLNSFTSSSDNQICEKPKYSEFLHLPHGLDGYFDYEQGMDCARKTGKPVFIDFTGHGCVNCREMEANVWSDPRVLSRLKNDFVIIALYVDDKTLLPESEWITSSYDGKVKKTLGKKYADFQISRFNVNAQPYYVLIDHEGKMLVNPKAYDLKADNFVEFLDKGIAEFKKRTL